VLIDRTNGRVLDVLESREKTVVVQWLKAGVSSGLLAHLEEVTSDMWDGYVEAVKEVFEGRVRITIDREAVVKPKKVKPPKGAKGKSATDAPRLTRLQ